MTDYNAKALTAAHKTLQGKPFATIAEAHKAAHAAILAKMPEGFDPKRINFGGEEQGAGATLEIRVEPTDAKGDAFAMTYRGSAVDGVWTFAFSHTSDLED